MGRCFRSYFFKLHQKTITPINLHTYTHNIMLIFILRTMSTAQAPQKSQVHQHQSPRHQTTPGTRPLTARGPPCAQLAHLRKIYNHLGRTARRWSSSPDSLVAARLPEPGIVVVPVVLVVIVHDGILAAVPLDHHHHHHKQQQQQQEQQGNNSVFSEARQTTHNPPRVRRVTGSARAKVARGAHCADTGIGAARDMACVYVCIRVCTGPRRERSAEPERGPCRARLTRVHRG